MIELLIGQVTDTNSAWMGRELNKVGIEVIRVVSVRDRAEEITEAVDASMKRADIVLMTGGLGPTKDDITKQTLCRYFGTRLIFSEAVFENVKRVLAGKIPMNALNKSQAMVPRIVRSLITGWEVPLSVGLKRMVKCLFPCPVFLRR